METKNPKEYIAPDIKVIKVLVEQGFAITGIIINKRYGEGIENHVVDEVEGW